MIFYGRFDDSGESALHAIDGSVLALKREGSNHHG